MKKRLILASVILSLCLPSLFAKVEVRKDSKGWRMFDGDKEVEVKGITWSNTPIGKDYNYSLWRMDDEFIYATLETDMPLLKAMGVNVIRSFDDVPPKWVEYIYDKYGIYTLINNLMGRYGVTVKGKWTFPTDYQDKDTRETLIEMARETAEKYKNVRGLLFYMLGNESNYGLEWSSTEIENLPVGEQHRAKAVYLYSMFEDAMKEMHKIDPNHPVGIVNGDTQYIDLIAELCPSLDIFGSNVYRGWKFYDAFYEDVLTKLDKPAVFTECGADAFNAITQKEDQWAQLQYFKTQWEEVYQQGYGKGRHQNVLGAFLFEWIDEWWKVYQWKELDIHNKNASWANSGYSLDFKEGVNNMNEEWFGLCAISTQTVNGVNKRVPRAVYYFFCDLWQHSLYNSTNEEIDAFFKNLPESIYLARGNSGSIREDIAQNQAFKIKSLSVSGQYTTPVFLNYLKDDIKDKKNWRDTFRYPNGDYSETNGEYISKEGRGKYGDKVAEDIENKPTFQAESSLTLEMNPVEHVNGSVTFRAFTNEPFSRLRDHNMSYYETVPDGESVYDHKKHFEIYAADATYEGKNFDIKGYYHTGHAGYTNTGDVFNITQDAFDLVGYDTNGDKAPIAAEFTGKGKLSGFNFIAGPEIYGYATPQAVANYYKGFWPGFKYLTWINWGVVFAEEFGQSERQEKAPQNAYGDGRKASLYGEFYFNKFATLKLGALTAGNEKVGAEYVSKKNGLKKITDADTFGGYASISTGMIPYTNLYVNGIYRGLVADTNPAGVYNGMFTGDSGSGNRIEIQTGADVTFGVFSFKPVFRMRQPIEEPTGARSIVAGDPFYVGQGNRRSMELEAIFTYDPEGGTYFHNWDNNETENAKFAFSLAGLYKFFADETDLLPYKDNQGPKVQRNDGTWVGGDNWVAYNTLPLQKNLWQLGARIVTNPTNNLRVIATVNAGHVAPFVCYYGDPDDITFYGGSVALRYKNWIASSAVTVNGWGPEGWHREQNWTFPLQYSLDVAYGFKKPSFLDTKNRIGLRILGTNFGKYSQDSYGALPYAYHKTPTASIDGAKYMEVTAYFNIGL
ncbi:glycoside hydrolase family 2 TIM barrel-domain containing protein [Treponema zioleckii]|uniref:glycoside hydrolase family 2 TIM barrel-domain containing protein n=1 Tax=Treponema zioleckii TaxID=331680 RepID=UPI00168ADE0D|nr:glycoside hydrolase family 2 TIM barrel-domain containing protein [Treponema zioleckii]